MLSFEATPITPFFTLKKGLKAYVYGRISYHIESRELSEFFRIPSSLRLYIMDAYAIALPEGVPPTLQGVLPPSFNNTYFTNFHVLTALINPQDIPVVGKFVKLYGGYNRTLDAEYPVRIFNRGYQEPYLMATIMLKEDNKWTLRGNHWTEVLDIPLNKEAMPDVSTRAFAPAYIPKFVVSQVIETLPIRTPETPQPPQGISDTSKVNLNPTNIDLSQVKEIGDDLIDRQREFRLNVFNSQSRYLSQDLEAIWDSFTQFALEHPEHSKQYEELLKSIVDNSLLDALGVFDCFDMLSDNQKFLAIARLAGYEGSNTSGMLVSPYRWGIATHTPLGVCDLLYAIQTGASRGRSKMLSDGRDILNALEIYNKKFQSSVVPVSACSRTLPVPYERCSDYYEILKDWLNQGKPFEGRLCGLDELTLRVAADWGIFYTLPGGNFIISGNSLYKEVAIYEYFSDLSQQPSFVSRDSLNLTVQEFQRKTNITLTKQQRSALELCRRNSGVLSGCAGSGKTTVCKLIASALDTSGYTPIFAAPTGKAARRLSESVETHVSTLHSLFRLNPDNLNSDFDEPIQDFEDIDNPAFVFDEMAMCSTDLLYQVVNKLPYDAPVYLIGDTNQLPPIGKGIPFKRLFNIVPSVELGVSQRSALDSTINKNCSLLISSLDSLDSGQDFNMVSCPDEKIIQNIQETCRSYLGMGYSPEDIQVLTPYSKQSLEHKWSTSTLNPMIQKILNPNPLLFVHRSREFRYGDRVIHTANDHARPRYRMFSPGVLEEVSTQGVVNGEVGKIVGLTYLKKNPQNSIFESSFYLLVSYYDVELEEDTIVLYQMDSTDSDSAYLKRGIFDEEDPEVVVNFYSKDLNDLMLAYALTVHKSQGSQYPAIIFPMGSNDSPNFVNCNMIYTAISRAQQRVTLVGSVKGAGSAMERGRRVVKSGADIHDVYEYFLSQGQ